MEMSAVETKKIKSIYYALLVFTLAKGFLILVPNVSSAIGTTYLMWTTKDSASNITDGKTDVDRLSGETIWQQWIGSLLLLNVILCEILPIEIHVFQKWPIRAYFILVWTMMHHLFSYLYIIYIILGLGDMVCAICSQAIAVQGISAILTFTILVWSRVLIQSRMSVSYV